MKFAAKLDANKFEDWPYIEYKAMKKLIKHGVKKTSKNVTPHVTPAASPDIMQAGKKMLREPLLAAMGWQNEQFDLFLDKLREQRDVVEAFFVLELERNREQFELLLASLQSLFQGGGSKNGGGSKASDTDWRSESSLVRAATDLYRRLQQLRNYAILNYTGLVKLAKKFDKAHHPKTGDKGSAVVAEPTPPPLLGGWTAELQDSTLFTPDALDNLISQLEETYARHFCDGSVQVARATLLVRKVRPNSQMLVMLGVRAGVILTLTFWLLWDVLVDVRVMDLGLKMNRDRMWVATQMPLCRVGLAVVLMQFLWAGCLYVMSRARINFEYMLDFGPRANTNAGLAASDAARSLIFYLLSLLLFVKALIGELPKTICPGVFPVAMVITTVGSFSPLQSGSSCLHAIAIVLAAPCFPVDLFSVLVGDVLTSLVKPLQDLAYAVCYIGTREFLAPYPMQGDCHNSILRQEYVAPLICALPLWCRFMQCLRVFHDSHKRFPNLPNALKYSVAMLVVLFGEVHPSLVAGELGEAGEEGLLHWIHFAWIFIYLLATLYMFAWDVRMDWKLGDVSSLGLRERRMFQYRAVYYAAICFDLVLRFGWTATLVPHWFAFARSDILAHISSLWLLPIVTSCELLRRAMWLVLRLESEHLHNTDGFRRIDVVPLHFDHAVQEQERRKAGQEFVPGRRVEILVELLVYAAVVFVLGAAAVSDFSKMDEDSSSSSSPPGAAYYLAEITWSQDS